MVTKQLVEQVLAIIQSDYKEMIRNKDVSSLSYDENDCVTLYHGTSTVYLNQILREGLLPRSQTGVNNWDEEVASIDNVVYLTNKWHYAYAIHAHIHYLKKEYGENFAEKIKARTTFPCYIECKVPKGLLVMDEDFILSTYFQQNLRSHLKKSPDTPYMELPLFDPIECLDHYGTVGVLGGISPSMIISFTVLGDEKMYEYLLSPSSPYMKEWKRWKKGKGKGKIKLRELWEKEAESNLNGTWFMSQVIKGTNIEFGLNEATGKLAMVQK